METSEWIALAAVLVAVVAAGAAIKYPRQSVTEAKRSADRAGDAVVEARRAADEAARMREIDEERRWEERERRHEGLAPELPGKLEAEFRPNERLGGGHGSLFGTIKVPRGYRVRAEALRGQSRTELGLSTVAAPDREIDFHIEPWHPEQERARTTEILFKFWPPMGTDDVSTWSCGCGRPDGGTTDGPGHWEQRVKVSYYRDEDSVY